MCEGRERERWVCTTIPQSGAISAALGRRSRELSRLRSSVPSLSAVTSPLTLAKRDDRHDGCCWQRAGASERSVADGKVPGTSARDTTHDRYNDRYVMTITCTAHGFGRCGGFQGPRPTGRAGSRVYGRLGGRVPGSTAGREGGFQGLRPRLVEPCPGESFPRLYADRCGNCPLNALARCRRRTFGVAAFGSRRV